jgi:hypothetical protein
MMAATKALICLCRRRIVRFRRRRQKRLRPVTIGLILERICRKAVLANNHFVLGRILPRIGFIVRLKTEFLQNKISLKTKL